MSVKKNLFFILMFGIQLSANAVSVDDLTDAIKKDDVEEVKRILAAGVDVDGWDSFGDNPLVLVSGRGNYSIGNGLIIAKLLIDAGADVNNAKNRGGDNPLSWTVKNMDFIFAKFLLDSGANPNASMVGWNGGTVLMFASALGNRKMVELLVNYGADINAESDSGDTALTLAQDRWERDFYKGQDPHGDIVRYLVLKNPRKKSKYSSGSEQESKHDLIMAIIMGDVEGMKKILATGINVSDQNFFGRGNALMLVTSIVGGLRGTINQWIMIAKLLIDSGIDVNVVNGDEENALALAVQDDSLAFVKFLLNSGANINARIYSGRTVLMVASSMGYLDMVKLLMDNGADINAESARGDTALSLARERKHEDVVQYLESKNPKKKFKPSTPEREKPQRFEPYLPPKNVEYPSSALKKFRNKEYHWEYAALQMPMGLSKKEMKFQYKKLLLKYHPDKYSGPLSTDEIKEVAQMINVAAERLGVK